MSDRKKMINELTYQINSNEVMRQHYPVQLSVTDARKILELLKEQEPVKPEPYLIGQPEYKFYRCPVCKVAWYYKGNYCLNCGRPVKWDD